MTNAPEKKRAVPGPSGDYYPDIVVIDSDGKTREIGDVEEALDPTKVPLWKAASEAGDPLPEYETRIFFLYVPEGQEEAAKSLLTPTRFPMLAYAVTGPMTADKLVLFPS